jgi:hypothetical protein
MAQETAIKLERVLKATAFFVMGHLAVYFSYQLFTYLFAKIWGLSRMLTFNLAIVEPHYFYWSKFKIIVVFGAPTILLLLIGLVLGRIAVKAKKKTHIHYFLHWFSIAAVLLLPGQFFVNFFFRVTHQRSLYLGISNITEWLGLPTLAIFAFMMIFMFISVLYGYRKAPQFAAFYMNPGKHNSAHLKRFYFVEQLILPIVLGVLPIMLLMNHYSLFFQFFCLMAYPGFIMGALIIKRNIPFRFKEFPDIYSKVNWRIAAIMVAVWLYLYLDIQNII